MLESWGLFWQSDIARAVSWERDHRALERLFTLYELRGTCFRESQNMPYAKGSQGQIIANPLLRTLSAVGSEITALEDRFGLTPRGAAQLGLTVGGLKKTIDDLNRDANRAPRKTKDPRLIRRA